MQQPPAGQQGDGPQESYDSPLEGGRRGFSPFNFLFGFGIGAFVGVGLALLAFAMVDDNPKQASTTEIQPDGPLVVSGTVMPTPDTRPTTRTALDVRLGPGNGFAVVGVLAKGDGLDVVGRDDASEWLAIRFPPGSAGRGWIPVTAVETPPDLEKLAVALPTPLPRTVATSAPSTFNGGSDSERVGTGASTIPTRTPDPRATAVLRPGPVDLVVTSVRLLADRRLSVTVANRGPNDLVGFTVFVQVRDLAARSEMVSASPAALRVGETLTVETTSFRIAGEERIQAIADPFGAVPEVDRTNNLLQVVLAVPISPTPTATPRIEE